MSGANISDAIAKIEAATGHKFGHGWAASETDLRVADPDYLDVEGQGLHETLLEQSHQAGR